MRLSQVELKVSDLACFIFPTQVGKLLHLNKINSLIQVDKISCPLGKQNEWQHGGFLASLFRR